MGKEGDLGGYIENESNLSYKNNCWVAGNAKVYGDQKFTELQKFCGNSHLTTSERQYIMYKYEIKPTLCAWLVARNTRNLDELYITISGYKNEPYVDTIISKDIMHNFLGGNNFNTIISNNFLGFSYSYEFNRLRALHLK
ncbi:hypothetical protein ABID23_000582 [Bartonella silvatica]|uniref:Uncharacterized protein n=1 Tax=Bartonella silvatica TaxID=357760 RepID=A0ABV2HG19_9HYPH